MSVEATILRIAEQTLGLVTLSQLLAAGLSRRQVFRRVASGVVVRLYPGVYRVASSAPSLMQSALAACLLAGDGAFAPHMTSFALLELADVSGVPIEITAPADRRVRVPGLTVHRSAFVGPRERKRRGPLAVSSAARSIIDIAGAARPRRRRVGRR